MKKGAVLPVPNTGIDQSSARPTVNYVRYMYQAMQTCSLGFSLILQHHPVTKKPLLQNSP